MNKNKEVKSFIFYNNIVDISTKEIAKIEFKKDLFLSLTQGIYLNEFLIQLFHNKFDVFLSSISFDIKDEVYSYSYMDEEYLDDYGFYNPKDFLDEEYGRIELDIYKFDDYIRVFGMDEDNFEFSILGKQLTKPDVKIYF